MERILYITSQFPFGDGEAFLGAEARALAALAPITVVAMRPKRSRPRFNSDLSCFALSTRSLRTLTWALRTLVRQPGDCAAVAWMLVFTRYRFAAKVKNVLVLVKGIALADYVRQHRISAIHAHWLTTSSTVGFIAARLTKTPLSVSAHRFDLYADNLIAQKVADARAVRVISERSAQLLRALLPEPLHDRIHVVHLGVERPKNLPGSAPRLRPLRVVAIGGLVPVKGHADLLDALARVRDADVAVQCDIIGEGPLRPSLQAQIERLHLGGTVRLRGFVAHERIQDELESGGVDLLVHPSVEVGTLHEGIPVAMMEAMANGIPCIATRTGSIPELVDQTCGILVEQQNPDALSAALLLLARDESKRAAFGLAARERIDAQFGIQTNARRLLGLITSPRCGEPMVSYGDRAGGCSGLGRRAGEPV
jgi:colanic acid/amylovoran biosynthesis glycosyltransferase